MVSALLSRFTSRRGDPWHGIRGPLCDSPSHKRAINPGDKRSVTVTRGHPPWPRQPVSSSSAPTVTNSSTPARALAGIGLNRPNSGALGRALPAVAMAISASPSWGQDHHRLGRRQTCLVTRLVRGECTSPRRSGGRWWTGARRARWHSATVPSCAGRAIQPRRTSRTGALARTLSLRRTRTDSTCAPACW
jgi:hypothetical protein